MPLTYQGPLSRKPARSLTHAFNEGQERFKETGSDQIDLRLVFESIKGLKEASDQLGGEQTAWVDLAVYPTDSFATFADQVLSDDQPSRLSCLGACQSIRIEISIEREQTYMRRFDDRLCYEGTGTDSILVRIQAGSVMNSIDQNPALLEGIIHRFHLILSSYLEPQQPDGTTDFTKDPIASADTGYFTLSDSSASQCAPVRYQLQKTEKRVSSILLRVDPIHKDTVNQAWKTCVNQLTRLEQCHVRLDRAIGYLDELSQTLELYHDHHWSRKHGFGMSINDYEVPSTEGDTVQNAALDSLARQAAEWDIRWRGRWGCAHIETDETTACPSRYIVRSSGGKSVDQLFIELPIDNADSPEFRAAQLELSSQFDDRLAKRNAWQFEGPLQSSEVGQLNVLLQRKLENVIEALPQQRGEPEPAPAKPPNILSTIFRFITRRKVPDENFTDLMADQISGKCPGFRYDQRAHVSADYFLEFYRKHEFGYDLIQIQRMRNPERFKVYLGSSEFKVYLDDLSPTPNRIAPGIVVDFESILPPEWDNEYHLFTRHNRRKAIETAVTHLAHFASPFFDAVRPILQAHKQNVENGALQ